MAKLDGLIKLHKFEVDEKRRVLAELFLELEKLQTRLQKNHDQFESEKNHAKENPDLHHYIPSYMARYQRDKKIIAEAMISCEEKIEEAKDDLLLSFSELKKFEMTEQERKRLAELARKVKEAKMFDDVALDIFRRQQDENL
jgi:flagellar export protein FliJ